MRGVETGLDYFGARYFAGAQGSFTSPDPGNVGADLSNAQSWNAYAYTVNNPLRAVDRNGLDYYLIGGDQCGNGDDQVRCDKQAFVLDSKGNRVVVKDQVVLAGTNGVHAQLDANGNVQITTGQGTFRGYFFDLSPLTVTVSPTMDELKLMALQDAGRMASSGVNAGMIVTAPAYLAAAASVIGIETAGVGAEATIHGATRMADAARMTPFRATMTRLLATAKYTQAEGAEVFVREVAGRFDVVVRNPATGRIITVLKQLDSRALANLARNFGWH